MSTREEPMPDEQTPEERRALFRVVRGEPNDAELAALTVVLTAAASADASAAAEDTRGRSVWADRAAMTRSPLHAGAGAWRNSTWPR